MTGAAQGSKDSTLGTPQVGTEEGAAAADVEPEGRSNTIKRKSKAKSKTKSVDGKLQDNQELEDLSVQKIEKHEYLLDARIPASSPVTVDAQGGSEDVPDEDTLWKVNDA